jgi:hypothetical protein
VLGRTCGVPVNATCCLLSFSTSIESSMSFTSPSLAGPSTAPHSHTGAVRNHRGHSNNPLMTPYARLETQSSRPTAVRPPTRTFAPSLANPRDTNRRSPGYYTPNLAPRGYQLLETRSPSPHLGGSSTFTSSPPPQLGGCVCEGIESEAWLKKSIGDMVHQGIDLQSAETRRLCEQAVRPVRC